MTTYKIDTQDFSGNWDSQIIEGNADDAFTAVCAITDVQAVEINDVDVSSQEALEAWLSAQNSNYSINGPYGDVYEVFADEGSEEPRFVGRTVKPEALIFADKNRDWAEVEALTYRKPADDEPEALSEAIQARFSAGARTITEKRATVNVSAAFHKAVEDYQYQQGLRSWSAALLKLAAAGFKAETGGELPEASGSWGGPRPLKTQSK